MESLQRETHWKGLECSRKKRETRKERETNQRDWSHVPLALQCLGSSSASDHVMASVYGFWVGLLILLAVGNSFRRCLFLSLDARATRGSSHGVEALLGRLVSGWRVRVFDRFLYETVIAMR